MNRTLRKEAKLLGPCAAIEALTEGEALLVSPGRHIPADGRIVAGHTFVASHRHFGESMPVDRHAGKQVFAGSAKRSGAARAGVNTAMDEAKRSAAPDA